MNRRISLAILLFVFTGLGLAAQEADTLPRPRISPERELRPLNFSDSLGRSTEPGYAIQDTTEIEVVKKDSLEADHSPRKAVILALALPGGGQAYNKKYWKLPIVYGALGGTGYLIHYNIDVYKQYIDLYEEEPSTYERYVKNARRNVELSIISLIAVYALQVVDAYVDANLYYWDVSPDLSVRVSPFVEPARVPGELPMPSYGMRIGFKF